MSMDQQRFQDGFAGDAMFWPHFGPELRGISAETEPCPLPHLPWWIGAQSPTIRHNQSQLVPSKVYSTHNLYELLLRKFCGSRINLPIIRGSWNCRRGRQVGLEELMTSPRCHWLSGLEEPWYRNPWVINRWEIPELNGGFDWQNHRTKRRI